MTQTEYSGSPELKQPDTLSILLPMGLWFELPDTRANRRGAMIVLRGLHRSDGRPLVTYEHLAQALGYADRRNVHNFWAEFEACGGDLAAFLQRRKKVDAEVVARCEQIWQAHPLWTCAQVLAEFRRRWPEQGAHLSEQNIRTAGHQVGFLGVQQVLRRQLAEGDVHYQEPVLMEALFDLADAGAQARAAEALPVDSIPELLEAVWPSGVEQEPLEVQAEAQDKPVHAVVVRLLAKLPQLLPAVGSTWRPTTSNAAERFLGAFDRFYRAKGPFQSVASFEAFSAEAGAERQGRCPLQVAGYEVGAIQLFHLLNRPNPSRLRQAIAAGYDLAA
jgi:hypothetical protein